MAVPDDLRSRMTPTSISLCVFQVKVDSQEKTAVWPSDEHDANARQRKKLAARFAPPARCLTH